MKTRFIVFLLPCIFLSFSCARSQSYKRERDHMASAQAEEDRKKVLDETNQFSAPKKRTVILPVWNDTPLKSNISEDAKEIIKDKLREQGRLNIVEDRHVNKKSSDLYVDADKINVAEAVDKGQQWGVSLIIVGKIGKIVVRQKDEDVGFLRPSVMRASVDLELRMVDVAGAKEVGVGLASGVAEGSALNVMGMSREDSEEYRNELINEAAGKAVDSALVSLTKELDRVSWQGRVVKVSGNRIYINAGRATGLHVGDILKVLSRGQDIYDPESGLYLGRTEGKVKGTLEVLEYFGEDGSATKLHSGGNFQESDLVQLY